MPQMSADDYMRETQDLLNRQADSVALTENAAILWYGQSDTSDNTDAAHAGSYVFMPDLGYLICWLRLRLIPEDLSNSNEPLQSVSSEGLDQRQTAAEDGCADLLRRFAANGYSPELTARLQEVCADNLLSHTVNAVWVLPGDLEQVIAQVGNPLAEPEREEDGAPAEEPAFDLGNPAHRERLAERLNNPSYPETDELSETDAWDRQV